jgi:hypothetical protein
LILAGYTPGNQFDQTNFVSFTYSSDLMTLTLGPGDVSSVSGSLPAMLPAMADVTILDLGSNIIFQSSSGGSWCAGTNGCNLDFGAESSWDQAQAQGVPEPASSTLVVAALGGLILLRRKKAGPLSHST